MANSNSRDVIADFLTAWELSQYIDTFQANSPFRRVKLKLCAIPSQNLPKRLFERPTPSPLRMKRVQRAERATRRDLMFKGGKESNLESKISPERNNTPSTVRRKIYFSSEHKEVPEEECLCEHLLLDYDTAVEQNTESSVTAVDTTSKDIDIQVDPAEFLIINIILMDLIKSDSDINSLLRLIFEILP